VTWPGFGPGPSRLEKSKLVGGARPASRDAHACTPCAALGRRARHSAACRLQRRVTRRREPTDLTITDKGLRMTRVRATSYCLPPPNDAHALVWRYMDFPKLISLILDGLYMCRLDLLGDDKEGLLQPGQAQLFEAAEQTIVAEATALGRGNLAHELRGSSSIYAAMRKRCYVSSWQLAPHEIWWMWKVYCGSEYAVALRSNCKRLDDALPLVSANMRDVLMGCVTYGEHYNPDPFAIVTSKHPEFQDENEFRVICDLAGAADDSPGFFLKECRLDSVAEAVVVSPFAPSWFRGSVDATCRAFGCLITVQDSALREPARQPH